MNATYLQSSMLTSTWSSSPGITAVANCGNSAVKRLCAHTHTHTNTHRLTSTRSSSPGTAAGANCDNCTVKRLAARSCTDPRSVMWEPRCARPALKEERSSEASRAKRSMHHMHDKHCTKLDGRSMMDLRGSPGIPPRRPQKWAGWLGLQHHADTGRGSPHCRASMGKTQQ
eukprot:scaffold65809_cov19-Tisochrysis_lutea.AAC.3